MLEHRGTQRMITGSSIHNQRIERFWRDMHRCVTVLYYRLFYFLEHQNHLDPDNDVHRYALHYVYFPRINHSLKVFRECWNHHSVQTENNVSPHQMFTAGSLNRQRTGLHALDFLTPWNRMSIQWTFLPIGFSSVMMLSPNFATLLTHKHQVPTLGLNFIYKPFRSYTEL